MAIARCARCDNLFNKVRTPICLKCQPDEDADYEKIRDLLVQRDNWSADELAEAAQIDCAVVLRMLDQNLLSNVTAEDVKCGRCGKPAISRTKRLCRQCLTALDSQVGELKRKAAADKRAAPAEATVREALDSKRR